jgi:hypothetical protein
MSGTTRRHRFARLLVRQQEDKHEMKEINRASLVTKFSHSNQSKQIYVPHVSQSHTSLNHLL